MFLQMEILSFSDYAANFKFFIPKFMIDLKVIFFFFSPFPLDIKTSLIGVGLISLDERVGTPYLEKGQSVIFTSLLLTFYFLEVFLYLNFIFLYLLQNITTSASS